MNDKWIYADEIDAELSTDDAMSYLVKILDRENGANFYKRYIEQRLAKDFICDLVKSLQANKMPTQDNSDNEKDTIETDLYDRLDSEREVEQDEKL